MVYPGPKMTKKEQKGNENYSLSHKILIIKTYNSVPFHLRAIQPFELEVGESNL